MKLDLLKNYAESNKTSLYKALTACFAVPQKRDSLQKRRKRQMLPKFGFLGHDSYAESNKTSLYKALTACFLQDSFKGSRAGEFIAAIEGLYG